MLRIGIVFPCLALMLLNANVRATCTITKDVTTTKETYSDCSPYRGCPRKTRMIEKGPIVYSCTETDISEVNSKLKTNVENQIFIRRSQISTLEPNKFSWRNLTEFYLQSTNTSKIVPGFFNTFAQLKVLEITNNLLDDIIDGTFSPLALLSTLNLSQNSIVEIRQHIFSGLVKLKVLDLSQNKISSISSDVFEYQESLQYVDISQNLLKDVGYVFALPLFIQTINLSKNRLIHFDFLHLHRSSRIIKIDLSENVIKNLTNIHLACISTFNISHNLIQVVDENVFEPHLELLDLSNNNISEIFPTTFQNATNLEQLYLEHNQLKSLPTESLLKLNRLKKLDLSYNNIRQIPFGLFNNLDELTYLDLSQNNMLLDFDTLSTLKSLELLNFHNNKVKNFDLNKVLLRFENLRFLSLTDNLSNCSELAQTIHLLQLKGVKVGKGNNTGSSNILGISCSDNPAIKEETIVIERKTEVTTNSVTVTVAPQGGFVNQNLNDADITALNQYENFTNAIFHKYAEALKLNENITSNTFLKIIKNFSEELGNQAYSYNNADSLYALTKNVSKNVNEILNSINETFSDVSDNIKTLFATQNESNDHVIDENLIISNILLLLILCGILGLVYYRFWSFKYSKSKVQEQVQLL